MGIKSVYSSSALAEGAVKEIKQQLEGVQPKALIYFASSNYDQNAISQHMNEAFPKVPNFGCSTSGEITQGKMLDNSLVAMAFEEDIISDIHIEAVESLSSGIDLSTTFSPMEAHFGSPMLSLDIEKYIGIVLIDGLSMREERLMDVLGAGTDINFIGGSAGDDLKFEKTCVYANGKTYSDAAVLAVLKTKKPFSILKTQSFKMLDTKLVATKTDEVHRIVHEFNGKPATLAYAEALGVPEAEVANHFMTNPTGLDLGENNVYVRSPQRALEDRGICFYCNIVEGMEVSLLESTNIVLDTEKALKEKIEEFGELAGLINFNCILRKLELVDKGQTEAYGKLFSDYPTIGFSTYGEEFIGHINQTSTMLLFKK